MTAGHSSNRDTVARHEIASALVLLAAYLLVGRVAVSVSERIDFAFWPLFGLATAIIYRFGQHVVPFVLLATIALFGQLYRWPVALGLSVGQVGATALVAGVMHRFRLRPVFESRRDVHLLIFVATAGLIVNATYSCIWKLGSGLIGADLFAAHGTVSLFCELEGVLIFVPAVLALPGRAWKRLRTIDFLASTLLLLVFGWVLFLGGFPGGSWSLAAIALPMLAIIRVAAVMGAGPAALHTLILLGFVATSSTMNVGPLQVLSPEIRVFALWGYFFSLSIASLMTAGLIGERDASERARQGGEAIFKALVEDNPALICRFHIDGHLSFANETFRRTFGVMQGMTTGASFLQMVGLENDGPFLERLQKARVDDPGTTTDSHILTDDGERWFRWTARAVKESSSLGVEFHAVGLEITEQVAAEAERRRIETHAVQAQKLESIGVLAGGIAHEFNNLLTAVMGNAELAQMHVPPQSEAGILLADVRAGSQRAAELTQQLLNYSVRTHLQSGPLDLSQLVRGLHDLATVAVPKRCTLRLELAQGLPLITADEARLKQLLMSLVSNAGEAVKETGGAVTIRTGVAWLDPEWPVQGPASEGWHVMLQVEDAGCGIGEAALPRIFEPFFTTKFPGRGLGLAAVLGIVRDHAGGIGICSRPGYGTSVRVFFPTISPITGDAAAHPAHGRDCPFCVAPVEAVIRQPLDDRSRNGWSSHVNCDV